MSTGFKKIKIITAIFAILLSVSLVALAIILIFRQSNIQTGSDSVTDNYIIPTIPQTTIQNEPKAPTASLLNTFFSSTSSLTVYPKTIIDSDSSNETVISIYKRHAADSALFRLFNMFPGDSHTRSYFIEVSHKGTVTIRFHADIQAGYEKLAEVLKCSVVLRGENKPMYDGLMRDMPSSINHRVSAPFSTTTKLVYDITVYLDTSVGNEYMDKELVADFRWWVCEKGEGPLPPDDTDGTNETINPDESTLPDDTTDQTDTTAPGPDDGELVSPETGVNIHFCIWFWIAMISIFINFILLRPGRWTKNGKKEGETNNEK